MGPNFDGYKIIIMVMEGEVGWQSSVDIQNSGRAKSKAKIKRNVIISSSNIRIYKKQNIFIRIKKKKRKIQ